MKINRKNILASFENYDQRTQDMLSYIVSQLSKQDKEINEYGLVVLQMIAIQYEIYFKALDDVIRDGIVNSTQVGDRTINQPKPQLDALQKADTKISKLLKDLGLSPLEKAKIKKLNKVDSEEESQNLYKELIMDD